jgi:hypothetical protein
MHKSAAAQPDPTRLMKARYSAWVKRLPKYLRATSHPDNSALQVRRLDLGTGNSSQQRGGEGGYGGLTREPAAAVSACRGGIICQQLVSCVVVYNMNQTTALCRYGA